MDIKAVKGHISVTASGGLQGQGYLLAQPLVPSLWCPRAE